MIKILEHWLPVLRSKELKKKPLEIEIASKKIVLFRDKNNNPYAINSRCPHRGMNLQFGKINEDRIVCPYHGWNFNGTGEGKSPCNPKLKINTDYYKIKEFNGFIWITNSNSHAEFPFFDIPGFSTIGSFFKKVNAPLEPVIDNFHEFEHFPGVHPRIGYAYKQIDESEITVNIFPEEIKVEFYPKEYLFWIVKKVFRLSEEAKYYMNFFVKFSPIYTIFHQGWINNETKQKNLVLANVVFFVPINDKQTYIVMFLLTNKKNQSFIKNYYIKKMSEAIIDDDVIILNQLTEDCVDIKNMKLTSYDKAVIEIRKRILSIYYHYSEKKV